MKNYLDPKTLKGYHYMIIGATGSGKSHAMKFLMAAHENVVVIDPHYKRGNWETAQRVIGAGRNWQEIKQFLIGVEAELTKRYQQMAHDGKDDFQEIVIALDEFLAMSNNIKVAGEIFRMIGQEGRKVKIFLCIASQSDLVKDLGIEGRGKARDNFVTIHMGGLPKDLTQERKVVVEIGEKKQERYIPRRIPTKREKKGRIIDANGESEEQGIGGISYQEGWEESPYLFTIEEATEEEPKEKNKIGLLDLFRIKMPPMPPMMDILQKGNMPTVKDILQMFQGKKRKK